jgi:hypothetical protein
VVRGEELPVPFRDDVDAALDHCQGALIVNGVDRNRQFRSPEAAF